MSRYIHELPGWPGFRWDHKKLAGPLAALRHRQGRLIGRMENLGFSLRAEATLQPLTLDVLKSSEIKPDSGPRPGTVFYRAAAGNGYRRVGLSIRNRPNAGRHECVGLPAPVRACSLFRGYTVCRMSMISGISRIPRRSLVHRKTFSAPLRDGSSPHYRCQRPQSLRCEYFQESAEHGVRPIPHHPHQSWTPRSLWTESLSEHSRCAGGNPVGGDRRRL